MTLAIKIGAGSKVFDDISIAYAMRGNQKLSITGTGVELKNNLTALTAKADGISSIKATSDIVVSAAEVTTNKAALLKLGTRSLVLQQTGGTETDTNVNSNFSALDAIYTKFKSLNMTVAPTIDVAKINGAVNLVGMQNLSGKAFSVTGTGADIKTNINSILKNINQIDKIYITGSAGTTGVATLTANQLRIIGDKINKSATATVVLQDTADNLLTTNNLALINKYNNTNLNPSTSTVAASGSSTATVVATASAHGLNTGDAVTWSGTTTSGTLTAGGTFFARKLSDTTFSLYTTNAAAVNTSVYTNQIVAGANITGSFTSQAGAAPVRVTTLNDVKVTSASIAQAQRFDALTEFKTGNSPVRLIPNIISQVDIADTVANLSSGPALAQTVTAKITTGGGAAGQGLMTVVGHGYSTGDAVTYSAVTTADGALTNNSTYYVGKSDSDKFALFTNKAAALAANYTDQTTLSGSTGYVTLTGSASGTETVTKLPTGADVSQNMTSADIITTPGIITLTGHGYKTGDAVTYSSTGTAMTGVVSGTTYFVGKRSDNTFGLFTTRANALAADLSTDALAAAATGFKALSGAGTGVHKFTSSQLDATMSAISRFKDGTGSVGRVTILGQGAVNVTDLNRIATQTNRGEGANNAYVAYSALGVDVNKNLQALYDNKTAGTAIDEIVVSDGTTTGKKAISLSSLMYNALKTLFTDGVEHPQGVGTNKNYAFTVSGASFGSASGLQSDANVATYAITGATYNDLTNPNTQLALELGRSKLKSLTSLSISDATQRSTITSLLNALGNPADRAKLKLTA